jgi:hypothetical protein
MKKTAKLTLYRICPSCGYFKPKDPTLTDEYCSRCGERLIGHCTQCHLEITDPFGKYCRKCGESIQSKNEKETNQMINNIKMKTLIPLILIAALTGEDYQLKYHAISSTAIITENQNYSINASLGQPSVAGSQSSNFTFIAGFWNAVTQNYLYVDKNEIMPLRFEIKPAYPNPFNPVTNISFTLPSKGVVETIIYDITGRIIDSESRHYENSGTYQHKWNGTDKNGKQMSSGIYFISISQNNKSLTQKLTLIK